MARQTIFVIINFASRATHVPRIEARKNRNLRVKGIVKNRRNPATGDCGFNLIQPMDKNWAKEASHSCYRGLTNPNSLHARDELTNDERWGVPTARRNDISRVVSFFDPVLPAARQNHGGDFVLPKRCKRFCYRNKP